MNIIKKIHIARFRGLENQDADFKGRNLNAIIGQNSAMKTTLLGLISTPFSYRSILPTPMTIEGDRFEAKFSDRFKLSPMFDHAGEHKWTLTVDQRMRKDDFTLESIYRDKKSNKLRFWKEGAREEGDGYMTYPVIYLSLKRLNPIGETDNIKINNSILTDEEKELYNDWHNTVLSSCDEITSLDLLTGTSRKKTAIPNTDYYDSETVSAGQDNLGKIFLSILSMKRLQENSITQYQGGIICIDELESTMYPSSQIKLLDFLNECSEKYSIQFFFTTHSLTMIRHLYSEDYKYKCSITYMKKVGKHVKIYQDISIPEIEADLFLKLKSKQAIDPKVKVYCEDEVGMAFVKCLVKGEDFARDLKYENTEGANIGNKTFDYLICHGINEFIHNLIIVDGDTKNEKQLFKRLAKHKNVVALPKDTYPEKIVYDYLRKLDDNDPFWEEGVGGYTKQLCFNGFEKANLSKAEIKRWFKGQKDIKGSRTIYGKMFAEVTKTMPDECDIFRQEFRKAYEYVKSCLI